MFFPTKLVLIRESWGKPHLPSPVHSFPWHCSAVRCDTHSEKALGGQFCLWCGCNTRLNKVAGTDWIFCVPRYANPRTVRSSYWGWFGGFCFHKWWGQDKGQWRNCSNRAPQCSTHTSSGHLCPQLWAWGFLNCYSQLRCRTSSQTEEQHLRNLLLKSL